MAKRPTQKFGGDWTRQKLEILAGYLKSYTTALKDKPSPDKPFKKAFIDAFAGTGYVEARRESDNAKSVSGLMFPDLAAGEPQELLEGSAKLALKTNPRFDKFIFIERSASRCAQLELLKADFPELAADIDVRQKEANAELQRLCSMDWSARRAVLFLDPFGMQVEWKTVEAIAGTKAIDLWLLFPLGIGVNRLLTRSGDIPQTWRKRLDLLLGTSDWYHEFYDVKVERGMFGNDQERVVKATTSTIGRYFNDRLKQVFAGVADEPAVLRNSANNPLYLLCFAVGSSSGKDIALRIARHLLSKVR